MKKRDLTTLALLGISAGLVVGGCRQNGNKNSQYNNNNYNNAHEQMSPDMQAFYSALSPDAQKKFMELDAQHKMMAIEMANQSCEGKNDCAGMGGCATMQNDCAGKNDCKGHGGPPVKNPDKAVDVQYKAQKQQRNNMQNKMNY